MRTEPLVLQRAISTWTGSSQGDAFALTSYIVMYFYSFYFLYTLLKAFIADKQVYGSIINHSASTNLCCSNNLLNIHASDFHSNIWTDRAACVTSTICCNGTTQKKSKSISAVAEDAAWVHNIIWHYMICSIKHWSCKPSHYLYIKAQCGITSLSLKVTSVPFIAAPKAGL